MKSFASRYLLLVAFSVLLGACQSTPPAATEAPDARAAAIAQLEQSLASSELATAEDQLAALQAESPNDQSLEQYQRQLAEAYLMRSQIVLQKGDVNAAATALSRARALMPKAPALTGGVNGAIAQARKAELEKAEAALQAAEAQPKAKVIDPTAESTTVALNINDMGKLRRQLDAIAADVVNFQCDVSIQAPRTEDYPWLANLLSKRVKKLDPEFDLKLERQILRSVPAQMVLSCVYRIYEKLGYFVGKTMVLRVLRGSRDKRRVTVALTSAARSALESHAAFHETLVARAAARLSEAEIAALSTALASLHAFFAEL